MAHLWALDGSHLSFRNGKQFIATVRDILGYTLAQSTAYLILETEQDNYDAKNGLAFMTRPDIRNCLLEIKNAPLALRALVIEPVDEVIIGHRKYKFDPSWHNELKAELERFTPFGNQE